MGGNKRGSKPKKGKPAKSPPPKATVDPAVLASHTFRDIFSHPSGDVYAGEFRVVEGSKVVRHGMGQYFCSDGCVMHGRWEDDVLLEAVRIGYPDGSTYQGPLPEGTGTYTLPQAGALVGTFAHGRPQALVTLTDLDGHKWQGHADPQHHCLVLAPRNQFFDAADTVVYDAPSG